jgi:uncharacterized protein DUF4383
MAKTFSMVLGVVLLVVGIWGMVTGGGHDHMLLVFGINTSHNWVHLLSGALGLITGLAGERAAKTYLLAFGTVYGLVTILGFLNVQPVVQMLNLNMADNLLHLAISAACLIVGMQSKPAPVAA